MRKLQLIYALVFALALSSCEYVKKRILEDSIDGTYTNAEGTRMEFTESKVTYHDIASFNYKVEGKYLYVENFGIGELKFGDMRYEIIDQNTLKLAVGFSKNESDSETVFKKLKE